MTSGFFNKYEHYFIHLKVLSQDFYENIVILVMYFEVFAVGSRINDKIKAPSREKLSRFKDTNLGGND